jgi:hypothetical protein
MVVAFRLLWLIIFACFEHLKDGLAWPALIVAFVLGWRGIRPWWLLAPIVCLAGYANHIYAYATGETKIAGVLGNVPFELMVFGMLSLVGYVAGRFWRRRRLVPSPRSPS